MKKVLVTGASGFLGANLVHKLHQNGYTVRIFARKSANLSAIADIPYEVCLGNFDNKEEIQKAVTGCDIVVHTASITEQWGIGYEEYEAVNYNGTKLLAEAAMQNGIEKFIHVSTANTMAPGSIREPGNELNGFTLFHANSGYINSKYLAQQYILEQVATKNFPAVVVNPTFMIGPNDVKPSSGKLVLHGLHKKVLFYPPGGKNFVYIDDVCNGIIKAIAQGKVGDCYLLAGENLSYRQFFELRTDITQQGNLMIKVPAVVLKLAGLTGSLKQWITGKDSKLSYSGAYLLCLDNYYTGKKSERELQLQYTPIRTALSNALSWFKQNNYY